MRAIPARVIGNFELSGLRFYCHRSGIGDLRVIVSYFLGLSNVWSSILLTTKASSMMG
jgi:hypothetical protein